ncbi:MAG TPA: glycosyltransferase [Vicinamibacteria bacterium]|nr:glycosyltransferase [Vicinamibacteria bacterium]
MKENERVIAVVPARGGDSEVPYLNIKKLGPLPLIAHTLLEARKSRYIDRLVVSTDDDQVARVAVEYGAEVPFRRPKELSGDLPQINAVIRHAVRAIEKEEGKRFGIVVILQATSPFRTGRQIDEAIDALAARDLDSVISLNEVRTLTWRMPEGRLEPLFQHAGRREDQEPLYQEDGAIRVLRRDVLEGTTRLGSRVGHVLMDKLSSITVHDIYDFWLAEKLAHLPRVLIRVDGGGRIGMGHVYRSLAVADALRSVSHADICFLMSADHPEGVQQVSRAGHQVRVLAGPEIEAVRDYSPNIIVNDRPFLDGEYLRSLATLGASTINLVDSIEDIERPKEIASVIIATMQEAEAELDDYYSGPAFAILRDSFQNRESGSIDGRGSRVVVSFGGSDPQGLTLKTLAALDRLEEVQVRAVLGPAFGYHPELEELLPRLSRQPTLLRNVEHMADILFESDLVICSGGMTVFEIAALGRPGVVLCQNAREKKRMESFERYGTILHLGLGTDVSEETIAEKTRELLLASERRRSMSEAGARLVDARGARRVAEVLMKAGRRGPANGGLT